MARLKRMRGIILLWDIVGEVLTEGRTISGLVD